VNKRVLSRPLGRCVGLDVHLDFIEIAICEEGKVYSAGRVPSTPEGIETLADSLLPTDRVALEVTGSSWEIVKLLGPHVSGIIVVSPGDSGIAQARAKTDRLDARTLARLLWTGELEAVGAARVDRQDATAPVSPRAARPRPLPRQERDPRRADAPPEGPPARV
jgi:transposase